MNLHAPPEFTEVTGLGRVTTRREPTGAVRKGSVWRQLLLITAGFFGYMGVRALVNGSESVALANGRLILDVESAVGLDWEMGMQRFVLGQSALTSLFNFVYAWFYWPMIIGTFAFTWFSRPRLFVVYRNALVVSGAIGLAIFALLPVAPPRFLDGYGYVDTVGGSHRSHFVAHPSFLINKFAALPSFHVGWVALAGVVLVLSTRRVWIRVIALAVPALMAVAVIVTGNHYVLDVVAGLAICLPTFAGALRCAPSTTGPLQEARARVPSDLRVIRSRRREATP